VKGLTIVGLGGSLSARSASLAALDQCLDAASSLGASVERYAVRDLGLPLYDAAISPPLAARRLATAVGRADGLIWSSPMYHGTVSGSFKNALDWLQLLADHDPPFLSNKPVGLISTAAGTQGLQAINTLDFVVRALRGWVVPLVVPIPQAWRALDSSGRLLGDVRMQLDALAREVVTSSARLGDPVARTAATSA